MDSERKMVSEPKPTKSQKSLLSFLEKKGFVNFRDTTLYPPTILMQKDKALEDLQYMDSIDIEEGNFEAPQVEEEELSSNGWSDSSSLSCNSSSISSAREI